MKLIIGVKGTGKTKTLIDMVNTSIDTSKGSVICIEKGDMNATADLNVALDNGMATARGSVKSKVYWYDRTYASIDLEEGSFQTVKKKVRRLILSADRATSIYITDISIGK